METIVGIEIFPVIAFVLFFGFFLGLLIYVFKMSKSSVETLSALPFEANESDQNDRK
jgi:hypothetical protein